MDRPLDFISAHLRNHAIFGACFALGVELFAEGAGGLRLFPDLNYAALPGYPGDFIVSLIGGGLALGGILLSWWNSLAGLAGLRAGAQGNRPLILAMTAVVACAAIIPAGLTSLGVQALTGG